MFAFIVLNGLHSKQCSSLSLCHVRSLLLDQDIGDLRTSLHSKGIPRALNYMQKLSVKLKAHYKRCKRCIAANLERTTKEKASNQRLQWIIIPVAISILDSCVLTCDSLKNCRPRTFFVWELRVAPLLGSLHSHYGSIHARYLGKPQPRSRHSHIVFICLRRWTIAFWNTHQARVYIQVLWKSKHKYTAQIHI